MRSNSKLLQAIFTVIIPLLLSACGGGNSNGASTPAMTSSVASATHMTSSGASATDMTPVEKSMDDPAISYSGRWGNQNLRAMVSGGGNRINFAFSGRSIALKYHFSNMKYSPIIETSIDGGPFVTTNLIDGVNNIATKLENKNHTIEIWTKGIQLDAPRWSNPIEFKGITLDPGSTLSKWPTASKEKMLVLGDSIAEGVLINGDATTVDATKPELSWGRMSFANQICNSLDLDCYNHSFGGSGLSNVAPGDIPTTDTNYEYQWNKVIKDDPKFKIVLVEIVNNDGAMNGDDFRIKYKSLLSRLKTDQPDAKIFCMSPIPGFAGNRFADVQQVAAENGCNFIDMNQMVGYAHPVLNHPDLAGQTTIANYVKAYISAKLN